jgi:hypothetical protein
MSDQRVTYLIHCIVENNTDDMLDNLLFSIRPQVSTIHYRDILAVVKEIDAEIANNLGSHEEQLKSWLSSYQQTNIDIFQHYTILPLRFGIMVDQKTDIVDFLANSYIHIKWALERLSGKAEFVVQLSWDLNSVLKEIAQDPQWIEETGKSIDLSDKVEVGRMLYQTADRKKKEIVRSVDHKLSKVALDSSDGRTTNELVIFNRSYLIEKSAESQFDEAMAELGAENESYLSFKCIGPIPPNSFSPLEFKRGNFDLINLSRMILSLPDRASYEHIRSAYRKLSKIYHPDKNPGNEQYSEYFKKVDEAYKILETYCYSCGKSPKVKKSEYSFIKDDVEEVFIVKRTMNR